MNTLFTKSYKISDFSVEKAKTYAEKLGLDEDEITFVQKGVLPENKMSAIDEENRTVLKYVSTISTDRDNDVILPKGIDFSDFEKNPVVLYGHNYGDGGWLGGGYPVLPIGKDIEIVADGFGLLAKQKYANHQLADDIWNMHKDGFPLASSIGFIPLETVGRKDKKWGETVEMIKSEYDYDIPENTERIYTKVYLLEHSDVAVPANQDALMLAINNGSVTLKSDFIKKDIMNNDLSMLLDITYKEIVNFRKEVSTMFTEMKTMFTNMVKTVSEVDNGKKTSKITIENKVKELTSQMELILNQKLGKI